jgi:hypothetical protein
VVAVLTSVVFPLINVLADSPLAAPVEPFSRIPRFNPVFFGAVVLGCRDLPGAALLTPAPFFEFVFGFKVAAFGFALVPVVLFAGVFLFEAVFADEDFVFFLTGIILPPCNKNSSLF